MKTTIRISLVLMMAVMLIVTSCSKNGLTLSNTDNTNQPQNISGQVDLLTDTVLGADLIVLGTITDWKDEGVTLVSDNFTVEWPSRLYTLSVEKVVKGDPSIREILIRVSNIGYVGEGRSHFWQYDHVLISLIHEDDNIYTPYEAPSRSGEIPYHGYDGKLWIKGSSMSRDPLELIMGRICKIMRLNGIPNQLNEPCPEPAEPASPPKQ